MPRCYMVKKLCSKYQQPVEEERECWSSAAAAGGSEQGSPGPGSPTEACVAPPYYSPLESRPSYLPAEMAPCSSGGGGERRGLSPEPRPRLHSPPMPSSYMVRSIEETEAAHDLLSLSQSLPPLPAPGVVIIQHISQSAPCCRPCSPIMQEMTPTYVTPGYHPVPRSPSPRPPTPTEPNYRNSSPLPITIPCYTQNSQNYLSQPPLESPNTQPPVPLTPPTSEYSSDAENNSPNSQTTPTSNGVYVIQQARSKVIYTYDALLVTDGRSKNKQNKKVRSPEEEPPVEDPTPSKETPTGEGKAARYVCTECGKQYATSSNLSRHKQTHRSLDSQSAKKCMTCGKAYVSMPALAMHVLTHKLAHSCGVCGKLFSRPWLLQGHLRSHTGEKPYGCAHCGKAFADRSNLRAHMQTHSADKNFECARCHKSFALKSYLNKHLESACLKDDMTQDEDSQEYINVETV